MYSPFWDKTITVFTPFISQDTIKWYKYIISNVFVKDMGEKTFAGFDAIPDKKTKFRIPSNNYASPQEWHNLSNKQSKYTILFESLIVTGKIPDVLEDNASGTYLFDIYACSKPSNITDNRYMYLPHISILGDKYGRRNF